jgi:hypothetical protein
MFIVDLWHRATTLLGDSSELAPFRELLLKIVKMSYVGYTHKPALANISHTYTNTIPGSNLSRSQRNTLPLVVNNFERNTQFKLCNTRFIPKKVAYSNRFAHRA